MAHQAPLSMEFSRREYWSRSPLSTPGDFPDPGMKPTPVSWVCVHDTFVCISFGVCPGAAVQDMCTQSGVLGTANLQNEWNCPPRISSPGELQSFLILVHKCDCQIFVFSFFKLSAWSWAPFSGSDDHSSIIVCEVFKSLAYFSTEVSISSWWFTAVCYVFCTSSLC